MPNLLSTLRSIGRTKLLQQNNIKPMIQNRNYANNLYGKIVNYYPIRYFSSITRIDCFSAGNSIYDQQVVNNSLILNKENIQRRWFLGCGDGEEGNGLSKVHEETLVLGYSPEQLFAVVAAVDFYEDFLPWCQRSEILRRYPDGSFDAELEIGFKFLVESYVSHVVLEKPKFVKTTSNESKLFEHLINLWEFCPGPTPETCNVHFLVDFKFQSPLYRQVSSMFFKEVVTRLVSSFTDRCRLLYGPGATIEQRA